MTTDMSPGQLNEPLSEEWPALATGSDNTENAVESEPFGPKIVKPPPPPPVELSSEDGDQVDDDEDDWENIQASETNKSVAAAAINNNNNPKILRHSVSSPNLSCLTNLKELYLDNVLEEVQDQQQQGPEQDGEESFSLVSSVASVHSISTKQSTASTTPRKPTTISWKDKVAKLASEGDHGSLPAASLNSTQSTATARVPKSTKKKTTTRYVVTPIKRCAKSTGDLRALAAQNDNNEDDDDHHHHQQVLGDSDAMEFYHRKALGAANRTSGLRLRPDEAKRKQFTLQKKDMQRNGKF